MNTITKMKEEIAHIMSKLGAMQAHNETEGKEPTSEERRDAHDLLNRIDDLKANIELEERLQGTANALATPKEEPIKPEVRVSSVAVAEQEKRDRFGSFGEQLIAVVRASDPTQRNVDRRLVTGESRAVAGLSESVQSGGGFLVQPDFSSMLIKNVFETGKLASRVGRISLSGSANGIKINGIDESSRATGSRWGGIQMYWLEEAGTKIKSKPKFRQIELSLKKLIGLCYATDELLSDASALEGVISQAFRNEMGFMIDDSIINGTGAGRPLGILNSAATVSQAIEAAQAADTVVYENVVKMWSRLLPDAQTNAVWLINQDVFPQLATMGLAVGTGGSAVYLPPGGATATPFAQLFGRPVIPMEQMATVGDTGDIVVGDFSNGYVWCDKGGVKQDVSIHVQFLTDQSVFRFVYRADGQPTANKAITPYKGTNTLSHFVKLAARA